MTTCATCSVEGQTAYGDRLGQNGNDTDFHTAHLSPFALSFRWNIFITRYSSPSYLMMTEASHLLFEFHFLSQGRANQRFHFNMYRHIQHIWSKMHISVCVQHIKYSTFSCCCCCWRFAVRFCVTSVSTSGKNLLFGWIVSDLFPWSHQNFFQNTS